MNIGLYIRLSLADEETGFTKIESESIVSQRLCLHRFLDDDKQLFKANRYEFVDDGFTATNDKRPQFQRMITKVQSGEINTIIVRDFSRFFRDYIEAGNYLECVFPFLGVRFISINDNYDSNDYKGTTGGLEMVVRNIIYASYSKDLSIKTRTAKKHLMQQGKFVGGYAPYGYKMHETEVHRLAIDTESSKVVRRIFDEALSGNKTSEIARILNKDEVPTMAKYFRTKYPNNKKFAYESTEATWNYQMIHRILRNKVYTGALVSQRRVSAGVGTRKTIRKEPIIVENTHEAIVSVAEFEQAGLVIGLSSKGNPVERKPREYALKSLVRCGNCKRVMDRQIRKSTSAVFVCYRGRRKDNVNCVSTNILESQLEQIAYNAITNYISLYKKKTDINRKSNIKVHDFISVLSELDTQIESFKSYKIRLYENYTGGEITKELFLKQKAETDTKIAEAFADRNRIEENLKAGATPKEIDRKMDSLLSVFAKDAKLTYEMAHSFIKAIYVYGTEEFEIEWNFKDIF